MQKPVWLSGSYFLVKGQFFTGRILDDNNRSEINLRPIWFWRTALLALAIEKSALNGQQPDVYIVNLAFQ